MSEQTLDEALASIGLDNSPITREDELYLLLTEGKHPRISNCRYWMIGEISRYKHMKELGIKVTKDKVLDGKLQAVMLSNVEYAKIAIGYFLMAYHLPYFEPLGDRPAANLVKMVDKLVEHPSIKEIIEKYG